MKFWLLALFPLLTGAPHAADRIALVIGNNAYTSFPEARQLSSPRADATDVADKLRAIGFTVLEPVLDGTRDAIVKAKNDFLAQAKDAQIALFYFSGHGFQVGEENFLIPSDMPRITSYTALKDNALMLRDSLMVGLEEARAQTKVIILDCCRDNPFAAQLEKALNGGIKSLRTKSITGEISGYGPGFYLAFATSPGFTAADGNGQRNSPFTGALLTHLQDKAEENIRDLFDEVKETVREKSGEEQVPWTNDSLSKSHVKVLARIEPKPSPSAPPLAATMPSSALPNSESGIKLGSVPAVAELPPTTIPTSGSGNATLPANAATTPPAIHELDELFDGTRYEDFNRHSRIAVLRKAQEKLKSAGLYRSTVDGLSGPGTCAAICDWQSQKGLPVTGALDTETLQSLALHEEKETTPPLAKQERPAVPTNSRSNPVPTFSGQTEISTRSALEENRRKGLMGGDAYRQKQQADQLLKR